MLQQVIFDMGAFLVFYFILVFLLSMIFAVQGLGNLKMHGGF